MNQNKEIEEDFLNVDKPLPGQNYVCMSFVSPEKVLNDKNDFYEKIYDEKIRTGRRTSFKRII